MFSNLEYSDLVLRVEIPFLIRVTSMNDSDDPWTTLKIIAFNWSIFCLFVPALSGVFVSCNVISKTNRSHTNNLYAYKGRIDKNKVLVQEN